MYTSSQIQHIEQRSIAIHNDCPHNIPISIDRTCFQKSDNEKALLSSVQSNFKRNGLHAWNERNRPGNNKPKAKAVN